MTNSLRKENSQPYEFIERLKNLSYVKKIYLFGSRARKTNLPRADIDLAIDCPDATDEEWIHILSIVDHADTLLEIDCVRFDKIKNQKFKDAILSDHEVLYE